MPKNQFLDPRIDDNALVIHADRLAGMTDEERAAYLDEFSGRQDPPPADDYKNDGRGKSLRELLGDSRIAALIARANLIRAKRAQGKP